MTINDYENRHNLKFPNSKIEGLYLKERYFYFKDEFGICKMHVTNVGKANYTMRSSIDKSAYLIKRLIYLHGNEYDYSLVKYDGRTSDKITLICKEHGKFEKTINTLITNKNVYCPTCYNEKIRRLNTVSNEEDYIKKAKLIHGDFYDYSEIKYITARIEISIKCPIHGVFLQKPYAHLQGYGCQKCARERTTSYNQKYPSGWSKSDWEKAGNRSNRFDSYKVYIIRCWNKVEEFYKVGRTYLKVSERFACKSQLPYEYEVVKIITGLSDFIYDLENEIKRNNKCNTYIPKIHFDGKYECFKTIKIDGTTL